MRKQYIIPSLYVKTMRPGQMIAQSPGLDGSNATSGQNGGGSSTESGGGDGLAKQVGMLEWGTPDEK